MTALYLGVPALTLALWLVHAGSSWRRPDRRDGFGVLLLAGLPIAAVGAFVWFGLVRDVPHTEYDQVTDGEGDLRAGLLILTFELVALWLAVLWLEVVLVPIRAAVIAPSGRFRSPSPRR